MLSNKVDASKSKSEGAKQDKILIVGTDAKDVQKSELRCDGKHEQKTLDFGIDGMQYVISKYEKNTELDITKRQGKDKGITH